MSDEKRTRRFLGGCSFAGNGPDVFDLLACLLAGHCCGSHRRYLLTGSHPCKPHFIFAEGELESITLFVPETSVFLTRFTGGLPQPKNSLNAWEVPLPLDRLPHHETLQHFHSRHDGHRDFGSPSPFCTRTKCSGPRRASEHPATRRILTYPAEICY